MTERVTTEEALARCPSIGVRPTAYYQWWLRQEMLRIMFDWMEKQAPHRSDDEPVPMIVEAKS